MAVVPQKADRILGATGVEIVVLLFGAAEGDAFDFSQAAVAFFGLVGEERGGEELVGPVEVVLDLFGHLVEAWFVDVEIAVGAGVVGGGEDGVDTGGADGIGGGGDLGELVGVAEMDEFVFHFLGKEMRN